MTSQPANPVDSSGEFARIATALAAVGVAPALIAATLEKAKVWASKESDEQAAAVLQDVWRNEYQRSFPALSALVAGTTVPFGCYPVLDYLASSCVDVAEGFERIARYFGLIRPDCRIVLDVKAFEPSVTFVDERSGNDWFFDEWTLGVTVRGFRQTLSGFAPSLIVLRRERATSEQAKKRAEATIGCPIRLGEPHAQLVFSRSQWEAKLPSGDARLRQTLERHADDLMDERRSTRETTRNVRGVLTRQLSGGEPTIKAVAKELAMSSRTLQRQLAAEGTTYQALLDALRADLAKRHLARGLGVSEVAFLLGYADGSAFARAFRRWFGKPPAEVRRP